MKYLKLINFLPMSIMLLFLSGCPKRPVVKPTEEPTKIVPTTDVEEPSIREGDEFQSIPELKVIHFDFDRYDLTEKAKEILKENAQYLKAHPELEILVEGHCCECGTNEYNLILGQKRALTVRDYYISLGIDPGRIATISYGEEKPINKNAGPPDSPLCAPNRRVETKVRLKKD